MMSRMWDSMVSARHYKRFSTRAAGIPLYSARVVEEGRRLRPQGDHSVTRAPSYVHTIEGRLRIKVPEVKGCARRARDLERQFGGLTPIEYVSANPVTG